MNAVSRPDNMLDEMEKRLGLYMPGNDTTVENGDTVRARFALDILQRKKTWLHDHSSECDDESEHLHGPFSPEANQTLEAVDGMVGQLMQAALANDPKTKIVIVSDHGFVAITHSVNLYIPFLEAGLMQLPTKRTGIEAIAAPLQLRSRGRWNSTLAEASLPSCCMTLRAWGQRKRSTRC